MQNRFYVSAARYLYHHVTKNEERIKVGLGYCEPRVLVSPDRFIIKILNIQINFPKN